MRAFLRTALAVIALIVAALALIAAEPAAGATRDRMSEAPAPSGPPILAVHRSR
jgi:hypothetical protein